MKTFKDFLESTSGEISHLSYLSKIQSIIDQDKKSLKNYNDYFAEVVKIFSQLEKTLEYGLKDESQTKEVFAKALELSKKGGNLRPSDFSAWSKMTQTGDHYGQ